LRSRSQVNAGPIVKRRTYLLGDRKRARRARKERPQWLEWKTSCSMPKKGMLPIRFQKPEKKKKRERRGAGLHAASVRGGGVGPQKALKNARGRKRKKGGICEKEFPAHLVYEKGLLDQEGGGMKKLYGGGGTIPEPRNGRCK